MLWSWQRGNNFSLTEISNCFPFHHNFQRYFTLGLHFASQLWSLVLWLVGGEFIWIVWDWWKEIFFWKDAWRIGFHKIGNIQWITSITSTYLQYYWSSYVQSWLFWCWSWKWSDSNESVWVQFRWISNLFSQHFENHFNTCQTRRFAVVSVLL